MTRRVSGEAWGVMGTGLRASFAMKPGDPAGLPCFPQPARSDSCARDMKSSMETGASHQPIQSIPHQSSVGISQLISRPYGWREGVQGNGSGLPKFRSGEAYQTAAGS